MSHKRLERLGRITLGERLLLDRRRRGLTQDEAAVLRGATRFQYGQWERDEVDGAPVISISAPRGHERCLLYRRRAGYTQAYIANILKRCRFWVNLMEKGEAPCDELLTYWER